MGRLKREERWSKDIPGMVCPMAGFSAKQDGNTVMLESKEKERRSQRRLENVQHRFKKLSRSLAESGNVDNALSVLIESIRRDPEIMDEIRREKRRKVALFEASDTGKVISIIFDKGDISSYLGRTDKYDLRFEATEATHLGILNGQIDPDSAFFTRKIKIYGPLIEAVRLKNLFLKMQRQTIVHG